MRSPNAVIALTGYPGTAELGVDPVDNPCEEEDPEPEVPGPSSDWGGDGDRARGTSYGDPHIITYDGYRYSFQTIGEFWLTAATDGHFQVQARQGQIPGRPRVDEYGGSDADWGPSPGHLRPGISRWEISPVWLDGSPFPLAEGSTTLPSGGTGVAFGATVNQNFPGPRGKCCRSPQTTMGGAAFF